MAACAGARLTGGGEAWILASRFRELWRAPPDPHLPLLQGMDEFRACAALHAPRFRRLTDGSRSRYPNPSRP